MAISPFKVIQGHRFWYRTKRKLIYGFLLVINILTYHISNTVSNGLRELQNCYIWLPLLRLTPAPNGGVPLGRSP